MLLDLQEEKAVLMRSTFQTALTAHCFVLFANCKNGVY